MKEYKLLTIYPDNLNSTTSTYSHAEKLINEHVQMSDWKIENMLNTGRAGEILVVFVRDKGTQMLND